MEENSFYQRVQAAIEWSAICLSVRIQAIEIIDSKHINHTAPVSTHSQNTHTHTFNIQCNEILISTSFISSSYSILSLIIMNKISNG